MTLLGRLLSNRRAGEAHAAWNLPHLQGPDLLTVTSHHFIDGGAIPLEHGARHIGGRNLSPHLAWSPPPAGTAQLLLVVEDIDVPLATPEFSTAVCEARDARPEDLIPVPGWPARQ
jgi:Phosphatidylethanolamine-binding protein